MSASARHLEFMLGILAAAVACVVAVLPPAGYFFVSYRYMQGVMETEAEVGASLVNGLVVSSPEYWKYQSLRIEEQLTHFPGHSGGTCLVSDLSGSIIASKTGAAKKPFISRAKFIYDSGVPVARMEIRKSLRPLLFHSAFVLLGSAFLGAILYFAFRMFPMRAVVTANRLLHESELKYRSLFMNMNEAVLLLEVSPEQRDARIMEANPACGALFSVDYNYLSGCGLSVILGSYDAKLPECFSRVAREGISESINVPCKGGLFTLSVTCAGEGRVAVTISDITIHHTREQRIRELTFYDSLTGLPNRALLRDRIKQAVAACERDGKKLAVILIGLDAFRGVNETFGHETGNRLLQAVAERLRNSVRRADTVARLGGDEFVILLSGMKGELNASKAAQSIVDSISGPYHLEDRDVFTGCSVGISIFPDDSVDDASLLANAAMALSSAKEQGRNRYSYYSPELNRRALERMGIESFIRFALANNGFCLAYQPQVNARSGAINGLEVLLRTTGPDQYSIPGIISIAEETGLIAAIGEWVLAAACCQFREWLDQCICLSRLGVNLSAKQFESPGLVRMTRDILQRNGIPPGMLEFELTESAIIRRPEEAGRRLRELKNLGVLLSVDDFCTGYSSLNYLKDFPIDRVKIDRSFVHAACFGGRSAAIVEAVIALSGGLGMEVIAEGVETSEHLEYLLSCGCEEMQGYYFARPLPAEQCGRLLEAGCMYGAINTSFGAVAEALARPGTPCS